MGILLNEEIKSNLMFKANVRIVEPFGDYAIVNVILSDNQGIRAGKKLRNN